MAAPPAGPVPDPTLGYVLVGGWPGSGKTTLARALAAELGWAYLGKDEVKEALMAALGPPVDVPASQRLGRAAVHALVRLARDVPGAVLDSTWYDYTRPLVAALPHPYVEVRTRVDLDTVRRRYRTRRRAAGHLDAERDEAELWGGPVAPLGGGPLLEVDTGDAGRVDVAALAAEIRRLVGR